MFLTIIAFTAIVNLLLGLFIYYKNRNSLTNISFALFDMFISIWAILNFLSTDFFGNPDLTIFFIKSVLFVTIPLSYFLVIFSYSFPNKRINFKSKWFIIYTFFTILLMPLVLTSFTVSGVNFNSQNNSISPVFGPIIALYFLYILIGFSHAIYKLIKEYLQSKGLERFQLQYLFLGLTITISLILITNLILVIIFNITNFVFLGPSFTLILVSFTTYSIIMHRLFDIRILLNNVITILILTIFSFLTFYSVVYFDNRFLGGLYNVETYGVGIFIALIFVLIVEYSVRKLQSMHFLKGSYDISNLSEIFASILSKTYTTKDIIEKIAIELRNSLQLEYTSIIIKNKNNYNYTYPVNEITQNISDSLYNYTQTDLLFYDEIALEIDNKQTENREGLRKLKEELEKLKCSIYIPLIDQEKTIGGLLIGEKRNGAAFTLQDINFLRYLSKQFSIAIQRTILYEESLNFNLTLQEKIDRATKNLNDQKLELQKAYDKLKETSQQERDMLDIMGHELRTPATIIKMASYLLEPKLENDDQRKHMREIKESIEREIELINTLLNSARLENNKIEIHESLEDIIPLIESVIEDQKINIGDKDLRVVFNKPEFPIPQLMFDKDRIREVLNNYISNAIKYSNQGDIVINLEISQDNKFLIVSVKDNGIGFKEEDNNFLFQKFHRLNNYTGANNQPDSKLVRPGGTGLGLYIVKGMINLHGGEVWAKSEGLNMGSTFYFSLPLNTQANPDNPAQTV